MAHLRHNGVRGEEFCHDPFLNAVCAARRVAAARRLLTLGQGNHEPAGGAVAAIGKRREDGQQRKRRESGVRRKDREQEVVDAPPKSLHPAGPPARGGAALPHSQSDALSDWGGVPGPTDPRIQEDAATIEWLLDQAWQRLSRMPEAPLCRELRLVVDRYRRAVREWTAQPPTQVQRAILLDCVKALHGRVVSRSSRET
jgi:hypothetical protein